MVLEIKYYSVYTAAALLADSKKSDLALYQKKSIKKLLVKQILHQPK